jgi:hypothetical protein
VRATPASVSSRIVHFRFEGNLTFMKSVILAESVVSHTASGRAARNAYVAGPSEIAFAGCAGWKAKAVPVSTPYAYAKGPSTATTYEPSTSQG